MMIDDYQMITIDYYQMIMILIDDYQMITIDYYQMIMIDDYQNSWIPTILSEAIFWFGGIHSDAHLLQGTLS